MDNYINTLEDRIKRYELALTKAEGSYKKILFSHLVIYKKVLFELQNK